MTNWNRQGRARASILRPEAKAECQRCGVWHQLGELRRQMECVGTGLVDSGYLVCQRCLDVPQEQFRTLLLPPNPKPITDARPSKDGASGTGPHS